MKLIFGSYNLKKLLFLLIFYNENYQMSSKTKKYMYIDKIKKKFSIDMPNKIFNNLNKDTLNYVLIIISINMIVKCVNLLLMLLS